MKKVTILLAVVAMVTSVQAETKRYWYNAGGYAGSGDNLWTTASNWTSGLPNSVDGSAVIYDLATDSVCMLNGTSDDVSAGYRRTKTTLSLTIGNRKSQRDRLAIGG